MAPSSPQQVTPQGVLLTIDGIVDGGEIYLYEKTDEEYFLPTVDYSIPIAGASAIKLAYSTEQNAWISTQEDVQPYKLEKVEGNTYRLSRSTPINFYAIIVAQVVNGAINWVNAEDTPRVMFGTLHNGFSRDEQSTDIVSTDPDNNTALQNVSFDVTTFSLMLGETAVTVPSAFTIDASQGINASLVAVPGTNNLAIHVEPSTFDDSNNEISIYYNDMYVAWISLWASD